MIEAPIFHVNGDDPEAVVFAAKVATEFRQKFQQAGRHRHVLLPPLRPQRRRRAVVHPAADVQEDPRASDDAGDLRQAAGRRRRRHRGRGREDEGRLARAARSRIRGGAELQAEQGRLARRPLVGPQGRRARPTIRAAATPASTLDELREIGEKITAVPAGLPRPQDHPALPREPRQGDRDRRGHRLGDRRGAGLRHAARRKAIRSACPARTASAAPSRSAIRC